MFVRNLLLAVAVALVAAPSALAIPQEATDLFVRDFNTVAEGFSRSYDLEARSANAINNLLRRQQYEELLSRHDGLRLMEARKQQGDALALSPYTMLPAAAVSLAVLAGTVLF